MSHRMQDGSEKPITCPLRSLSPDEHQYSHLDKEALVIILAITTLRQYLLGRHFAVLSDHRQLISLLASDNPILPMASARIQRWLLLPSAYNHSIPHLPGKVYANANILSHLPLSNTLTVTQPTSDTKFFFECL